MPLALNSTTLAASGGEAAALTVLVDVVDDPVDARVPGDGLVLRVDEDDLEPLVNAVLVDPVGVEDSEVSAAAADTLFSDGAEAALGLDEDTGLAGLSVDDSLLHGLPAATTANTHAEDHEALLGLVSQATGLLRAGGPGRTVDGVLLTVLPTTETQDEAHQIGLLLLLDFGEILVSSHDYYPLFFCVQGSSSPFFFSAEGFFCLLFSKKK